MQAPTDNLSASPLVSAITTTLTERISSGRYQDRKGFPSERELIEEFGVSRTIIRKALDVLEEQELLIRAPRCRTVVRQPGTSQPTHRATKRQSLGLWAWPSPSDPTAASVTQGVCQALNHSAYRLVIGHLEWDNWDSVCRSEARFLEQITEDRDIVGVLLCYLGGDVNLPALQKVRAANIPIVFMDRRPPAGFEADYVGVENEYAAEQAVRHLIAQGHSRIAHITNADHASTVAERMAGYRRALEKANIPFDPRLVVKATESSTEEVRPVYSALLEQLRSVPEPPTAVFAVNDVTAHRFLAILQANGLRVPEDMAVAGFDGIERWKSNEPFLTTIEQPFELLGRRAADLLLQRVESGPTATYQHILLQAPLSIYGSTLRASRER